MRNVIAVSSAMVAGLATTVPTPSMAQASDCVVSDAAGDADLSPGYGFDGEPYQDMLSTEIHRSNGAVTFSMQLAAPLPAAPRIKTGSGLLLWMWGMNTGPGVAQGFPLSPGLAGLLEFWIHLAWNGENFYAEVIDRRPALQGGDPLVTSVAFEIDGATVRVTAPTTLFDGIQEFRWGSSTWIWSTHLGSSAAHVVDRAPDGAAVTCPAPG